SASARIIALGCLLVLLCAPAAIQAQVSGGTVSGIVQGASGAVMPGVRVTVTDAGAAAVRTVTTDTQGFYSVPDLSPGNYEMTFSAPGFTTQKLIQVAVSAGGNRSFNMELRPGNPDQITRTTAPAASPNQSATGGNANAATVRDTPLNGRDW